MKKLLLLSLGFIAILVAFASIGPLAVFALSLAIAGGSIYLFNRTTSSLLKVFYIFVGGISAITAVSNLPALLGLIALYGVYYVYTSLKSPNQAPEITPVDPFASFEREWANLTK